MISTQTKPTGKGGEWVGALFLGVMSGTSLDGVDLAMTEINNPFTLTVRAFQTVAFDPDFRRELLQRIQTPDHRTGELIAVHHVLGRFFAEAIREFLEGCKTPITDVAAVGFHGLTFWHQPEEVPALGRSGRGTLQLGDAHLVHALTGLKVIFDFRHADMALGGQGAPLAPFLDHLFFRHDRRGRVLLNLGGIANLTFLPPDRETISAFDSGPGNIIVDALMGDHPTAPAAYDAEGGVAATGQIVPELLAQCLAHPYFKEPPPKSTGRELFGASFAQRFHQFRPQPRYQDLVATATRLTAETVAAAIRNYAVPPFSFSDLKDLIVSGGGAHNRTLLRMIGELLPELKIGTTAEYGMDPDAKEAVLMAALAWAHLHRVPANFPSVTGASEKTVLGAATP